MSDYIVNSPFIVAGPVTVTHSAPKAPIGLVVDAIDRAGATSNGLAAGKFMYCRGASGTAVAVASAGQFAHVINGSAQILQSANSALRYPVGCCPAVLSATNVYGWVQIQGLVDYARANASNVTVPAGSAAYLCATDGAVNPTSAAGSCVVGLHAPVSNASGTANSAAHKYFLDGAVRVHGLTALQ
jgi:hypothetical protein